MMQLDPVSSTLLQHLIETTAERNEARSQLRTEIAKLGADMEELRAQLATAKKKPTARKRTARR